LNQICRWQASANVDCVISLNYIQIQRATSIDVDAMERFILRMFRLAIVMGVLAWAIETGDLSGQARAFVDDAVGSWSQSFER